MSDLGRVRVAATGHIRKQRPNWGGYASVDLRKNGRYKKHSVHLLVIIAFIGPGPDGSECRHYDGDKSNNRATNLIWGTPAANQQDRLRHGTDLRAEKHPRAKLTDKQAMEIKRRLLLGETGRRLAAEFGVSPSLVTLIKTGKTRKWLES